MRSLGAYTLDRRPLAIPAYRRLWGASAVCAVGGSFSVVTVPTQLFTLTGSSAAVGAAAAVSFGALVIASLWVGALAEIVDRRRLLLAAHCGLALTYVALWAQAALGGRSVAVLLVLVACQGLTFGAIMVTMGAAVPRLVPVDLLPAANGLSSLVRYTGSIMGPLLAGVLIPVVGPGTLYLFDAVALPAHRDDRRHDRVDGTSAMALRRPKNRSLMRNRPGCCQWVSTGPGATERQATGGDHLSYRCPRRDGCRLAHPTAAFPPSSSGRAKE